MNSPFARERLGKYASGEGGIPVIGVGTSEKVGASIGSGTIEDNVLRKVSSAGQNFAERVGMERRQVPRLRCRRTELPSTLLHLPSPMHPAPTEF